MTETRQFSELEKARAAQLLMYTDTLLDRVLMGHITFDEATEILVGTLRDMCKVEELSKAE